MAVKRRVGHVPCELALFGGCAVAKKGDTSTLLPTPYLLGPFRRCVAEMSKRNGLLDRDASLAYVEAGTQFDSDFQRKGLR